MKMRIPHKGQRGMTILSAVLILLVVFFAVVVGMRIVPIYIQYFQIKKILESVKTDFKTADRIDASAARKAISKRFDIDYINVIKARDIKIRRQGGTVFADLDYEDRRELLYNLDIVAKFKETIQVHP